MRIKTGISCSRADEHSYRPGDHRELQHPCWRSPGFSWVPQVRCTETSWSGWTEEVGKSSNPHTPLGLSASSHCEREPIAACVSSAYVYAVSPMFPKQVSVIFTLTGNVFLWLWGNVHRSKEADSQEQFTVETLKISVICMLILHNISTVTEKHIQHMWETH